MLAVVRRGGRESQKLIPRPLECTSLGVVGVWGVGDVILWFVGGLCPRGAAVCWQTWGDHVLRAAAKVSVSACHSRLLYA